MNKKDFFRGLSLFAMFVAILPVLVRFLPIDADVSIDHSATFALLAIWAEIIASKQD